jgi:hypothetical protein
MTARKSRSSEHEPMPRSAIAAAASRTEPTLHEPVTGAFDDAVAISTSTPGRIAALLRGQSSRIVANWVLRAANLPAFRATPNLALDQLEQGIPALLDAALTAIASSDPTMDPEPLARALDLAEDHGRTRADEGFGVGVLLAEYQQLRMEVWNALWRIVDGDPALAGVPRELQSRLSSTFDSLAATAAEAWVEVRLTGAVRDGTR